MSNVKNYFEQARGGDDNILNLDGTWKINGVKITASAEEINTIPQTLQMLSDVSSANPINGSFLVYNDTMKYWEPDIEIIKDTTLTLKENARVWVDIDFPIVVRITGSNIPSLTTVQGNITAPQWAVNDFNVCEGQELIHEWAEGTPVYFHIHLLTNGLEAVNKYVRFEVEYFWANIGGAISSTVVLDSGELLIPANTATKTMLSFQIGNFTPASGKIAGHMWARLRRIAATGTAPVANPWVTMLQVHVLCDTIGSRNIGTK